MKNLIIGKTMSYIENNTKYDSVKLKEIRYGLVSIYITITKAIIISIISIVLGIFKEMIIFLLIYNLLRSMSFGLHATKTWICMISSIVLFIGIPYLCNILNIPTFIKCLIGIIGIFLMFKNSPADTKKKPIVNYKRRMFYKTVSTITTIIYSFLSIIIKNNFIVNCFVFAIVLQNLMISPTVYKIFKPPYNNYISFLKDHPDFVN